ncbi:tetratricopeptide repeat protein [Edaphovirga cremea]|uniref:tetratricopeptide repeat protein n=1 Tax=Edaphovirga cremea TaxID=2267246 RepID=UPI000DEF1F6B|nr:tetratricopeptide repeat protein [Edaphovirga cremea]
MKVLLPALLTAGFLFSAQSFAKIDEPDVEADCEKIADYAALGNAAYQKGDYVKAADHFRDQVAWSEFCQHPQSALATAYNNSALAYLRQGQLRKARAWLALAADDKKSQYNLSRMQDSLTALAKPTSPVGEYWQYAGFGSWNTVEVKAKGERYEIHYDGLYMGAMALYYGPNIGEFTAVAAIKDQQAVYHQSDDSDYGGTCDVEMVFSDENVALKTHGDCGFGHNVRADGEFVRVAP